MGRNNALQVTYDEDNQIRSKTLRLRSSLRNCSDVYILARGNITVSNTSAQDPSNNAPNKKAIFKNCTPFPNCISRISNMQVDYNHGIYVVIPPYNVREYSNNYSESFGIL